MFGMFVLRAETDLCLSTIGINFATPLRESPSKRKLGTSNWHLVLNTGQIAQISMKVGVLFNTFLIVLSCCEFQFEKVKLNLSPFCLMGFLTLLCLFTLFVSHWPWKATLG